MKKIVLLITAFILSTNFFAHSGIMSGQKDIRISKTKYFDIIYAKGSEQSAEILYQNADDVYRDLAEQLGLKHEFRLPVVISPAQDEFNAYFSCGPFNHIVIFDTVCTESIAVFTDEFLMTFRHELTHAITYNLRNDFWFGLDKVFGDVYNPALLTITTAWAEGATVSIESQNGEGRVNDEYALQMVKQAKIEGNFPKYSSVQGAIDVYPSTTESYMFGGAFNAWLQNKYGMEKYAEFWYRCVNFKSITYFSCFKKVYGIKIKDAWKEFYDSIEVPEVCANPEDEKWCSGFEGGKKLSLYKGLSSWKKGFVFYDSFSKKVNSFSDGKITCLYKQPYVENLSISKDGRFIAESFESISRMVPKNKVRIYDLKNKCFFMLKEESLRDAAIIFDGTDYYLGAVKTKSAFCTLKIFKLEFKKQKVHGVSLVYQEKFGAEKQLFSLEGDLKGNLYFILKDGLCFSIGSFNVASSVRQKFNLPEDRMVVQGLNVNVSGKNPSGEEITFSWTKPGVMPRLGVLYPEKASVKLMNFDCSASVYDPVQIDDGYFYVGKFYDGTKIFRATEDLLEGAVENQVTVERREADGVTTESQSDLEVVANSKKFNSFAYNFTGPHGTIVPLAIDKSYKPNTLQTMEESIALAGLTYVTSTPWTNPIWGVTGGYNFYDNSTGASIFAQGGSLTEVFTYNISAHCGFNAEGFKQNYDSISLSSKLPLAGLSYAAFGETGSLYVTKNDLLARNKLACGLGNIHRSGFGYYDYSGIQFSATLENDLYFLTDNLDYNNDYSNVGFDLIVKDAHLIPITLEGALFPTSDYMAAGLCKMVLFNKEIQGSTDFLPLFYANRVSVSAYYLAKCQQEIDKWAVADLGDYFSEGGKAYHDELAVTATFYVTPNLGGLARPDFQFGLTGGCAYRFFPEENQKKFQFVLGTSTAF